MIQRRWIWSIVVLWVMITAVGIQAFAEVQKDNTAQKPAAESRPVSEPNQVVAAKDPNDPNIPAKPMLPNSPSDPNAAISLETQRLILSRSISAIAASNWITQGQKPPAVGRSDGLTVKTQTMPYGWYRPNWLWDTWYGCNYYPDRYPDGEYFNYAGVKLDLDKNVSFELGGWTTSYLDGPYYRP